MNAWKKGAIFLVFLLVLTHFIKIDYPEYEVFEVTFDQSYSDNKINMFCDIVERRLGGSAFQTNNVFCEPKNSDTIRIGISGELPEIEGNVLDEKIKSIKKFKQKRVRIIINGKMIY